MKIKEQTRKLAADCSKHCFEVIDKTDEVSHTHTYTHIYIAMRRRRGLKRFSKSIKTQLCSWAYPYISNFVTVNLM